MAHMRKKKEKWKNTKETIATDTLELNMDSVCCDGNLTFSGNPLHTLENLVQLFWFLELFFLDGYR